MSVINFNWGMKMKKIAVMSLVASSMLMAGGFKIPETSTNAVALGAANIAHNQNNADAAYYNPAKMVFMSDENHIEADLMYVKLYDVAYKSSDGTIDIESEGEDFYIPSLHYVSGALGDNGARVGLSITTPGGLSKRWNDAPALYTAHEFTLETIEINPTAAFKVNDTLGVAVGFRILTSHGIANGIVPGVISQDMEGYSTDFGYNLAVAYQPTQALELGLTYRSKINMTLEGNADLYYVQGMNPVASYAGSVSLPLPAVLSLAAAYTFPTKTTLEVVYEKTYWSAYNSLNFEYTNPTAEYIFGGVTDKDWKDTNTFRIGLTQALDNMTLMAGLVIDESPVPNKTIGYELPDTDTMAVSLGGRYQINDKMDIGLAALYSMHDSRTITADDANENGIVGEFTDGDVLIVSVGLGYKF